MKYVEYSVSKKFEDIIQNYWKFEILEDKKLHFPIKHETLPENTISLVLINQPYFNGIRLLGPHIKSYNQTLMFNSIFFGIKFQPWVTIRQLTPDKTLILNLTSDVPENIKNYFSSLINHKTLKPGFNNIKTIEKSTQKLLKEVAIETNDMVKFICLQLNLGKTISEIVKQIPASIRVIQKQFKKVTGITMKQYASINRQRNTWRAILLNNQKQIDALLDNGYFDQSHFINEFKKNMTQSPSNFKTYLSSVDMVFK